MLTFFITMLQEILMSFNFTRAIMFMAIIVCIMLLSSPGAVATLIGGSLKIGSWQHAKENREKLKNE